MDCYCVICTLVDYRADDPRRVVSRNKIFPPRPSGHEAGQVRCLRVHWTLAFIPDVNYRGELSQEKVSNTTPLDFQSE